MHPILLMQLLGVGSFKPLQKNTMSNASWISKSQNNADFFRLSFCRLHHFFNVILQKNSMLMEAQRLLAS